MSANRFIETNGATRPARSCRLTARLTLALALLVLWGGPASAQRYEFTDLPLDEGVLWSAGINNSRLMVGWTADPLDDALRSGWISDGATSRSYEHPGAQITTLQGINDSGTISGYVYDEVGNRGLVLEPDGEATIVDFPGFEGRTIVWAINNRGTTTGWYCGSTAPLCRGPGGLPRGFIRSKAGQFKEINVPDALMTVPLGINDSNLVVGLYADTSFSFHGFVWSKGGGYETFDVPGSSRTEAHGVNNRGDIVGIYFGEDGLEHGFLLASQGGFKSVDVPGSDLTEVREINDRGDMTGAYRDAVTGERRVFIAVEKPRGRFGAHFSALTGN